MRKYTENSSGLTIDLDDESNFAHLPNTIKELESFIFKTYGFANAYIKHIRGNVRELFNNQKIEIESFIENFVKNQAQRLDDKDLTWFKEQAFLIEDMCENLC